MCFGLSFTDYDGFNTMDFTGLRNYVELFGNDSFRIALKNNLVFAAVCVPLTLFFSLTMALLVKNITKGAGLFKTLLFFPNITSYVAVAIVWTMLFHPQSGIINRIIMAFGVNNPPQWLISSRWALPAVIIVMVWKSSGYYMILLLGGLYAIPAHLYESAKMDGAGRLRSLISITLPMLTPTILFVIITLLINSFQVFDIINIMTEGGPGRSTNMLAYRIYLEAYKYFKFGYASAMSVILFLITLIITVVLFQSQKKWVTYMQ